jgi:hypothetical protein
VNLWQQVCCNIEISATKILKTEGIKKGTYFQEVIFEFLHTSVAPVLVY